LRACAVVAALLRPANEIQRKRTTGFVAVA
jgi:hypothetical protein